LKSIQTDGEKYEDVRSLNQELTFLDAEKEFFLRDVQFGISQQKTLGIIDLCNRTRAEFEGQRRIDKRDYPVEAPCIKALAMALSIPPTFFKKNEMMLASNAYTVFEITILTPFQNSSFRRGFYHIQPAVRL